MLLRRKVLGMALSYLAWMASGTRAKSAVPALGDKEGLIDWIHRSQGTWDLNLYRRMLGAANAFKEGDAIVGVAAADDDQRALARRLLTETRVAQIDDHPPLSDRMLAWILQPLDEKARARSAGMTLGELKEFLLTRSGQEIHGLQAGLSSDVIACVVRLMTNQELCAVGAKLFHPLPGSHIGSQGYMGARIQPNSPTDHPDDIRWQVLDAFAYAVGDVLVGTNPVSSEPHSVGLVENTLREILETFGIQLLLPHCVLSHIDIQAQVERQQPGSTALWFQSIAGSDAANATFDITIDKMIQHAQQRTGPFGLYFETGQGADFTNGHAQGTDMVLHEARKYGLARALARVVSQSRQQHGLPEQPWVHLNDVAGFIGPEVFRTREQLVRCCLEDIVMGKLHGLAIGLDICTTLHMDVSLSDLEWCIDQIMPAQPAYLMALPTRIDPMLGYLTTGYHDHVRIRQKFGYRVDDRMWRFFQQLGVIDQRGQPTLHFGDPVWVYLAYRRRKGDVRGEGEIRQEAEQQLEEVRQRGVFIARGYGASPSDLPPELSAEVDRIYQDAKQCIWAELPQGFEASIPQAVPIATQSSDRLDYILHPATGEQLAEPSVAALVELRQRRVRESNTWIVLSDGLDALALTTQDQARRLLDKLRTMLAAGGFRVAPETLVIRSGRVRAGYRAGEVLFKEGTGDRHLIHVIGERPGTGHRTLSIYLTTAMGSQWSAPSTVDHNITRVVSGIADTALSIDQAAQATLRLLKA
jgi:ethanolamine ammonia-lyase large subunit